MGGFEYMRAPIPMSAPPFFVFLNVNELYSMSFKIPSRNSTLIALHLVHHAFSTWVLKNKFPLSISKFDNLMTSIREGSKKAHTSKNNSIIHSERVPFLFPLDIK